MIYTETPCLRDSSRNMQKCKTNTAAVAMRRGKMFCALP